METLKVLGIYGSLRSKSTNQGLLRYAQEHVPAGMEIDIADLSEVPFYNADLTEKPVTVQTLLTKIDQADALLLACRNTTTHFAPALKNALD